jgi:uncharacterized lipoprotein YmbA
MVRAHHRLAAGATLALLALSACSSGPPPQIYVLGNAPPAHSISVSQLAQPVVEVKPVLVPDYLDTTDLLTRGAGGRTTASRSARWGERLSIGVQHAVAQSLAARLPQMTVLTSPPLEAPWRQVLIDVEAFAAQPGGQCILAGRWSVREGRGGKLVDEEKISLVRPVGKGSDAELVAAMTDELDELAGRITSALQRQQRR